ncbi:MAG: hypothetical protein ACPL3C_03125 [Pyrobaculum sp.]
MARLLLVFVALFSAVAGAAVVKWAVVSNPSSWIDGPYGACVGGGYVYVVGFDSGPGAVSEWRIEKRDKSSGGLVKTWTLDPTGGYDVLTSCVVVGDRLYVVGYAGFRWAVLQLDLDLSSLRYVEGAAGVPLSVASDGQHLYIAGFQYIDFVPHWRVEKRRLDDLSLASALLLNSTEGQGAAWGIGISPAGYIWVAGNNATGWRIEILDRNLSRVAVLRPGLERGALGVVFDEGGNAYVYGGRGVVKFSKDGMQLARAVGFDAMEAAYAGGRLYVIADISRLLVLDTELRKIGEVYIPPEIQKHQRIYGIEVPQKVSGSFDGGTLYMVGSTVVNTLSGDAWLIYAVSTADVDLYLLAGALTTAAPVAMAAAALAGAYLVVKRRRRSAAALA